jgi:hypothetical protein
MCNMLYYCMLTLFFFSDLRLICEGLPFRGAPGGIIEADICKYDMV